MHMPRTTNPSAILFTRREPDGRLHGSDETLRWKHEAQYIQLATRVTHEGYTEAAIAQQELLLRGRTTCGYV